MTATLGHNGGPSFDEIVRENLERGLLLAIKEVIVQAVRDPRLERRHLRVLAEVIDILNSKGGTAFPGRKTLADKSGYSEAGVGKTISELIALGYLVSTKRQAEEGGRALAHYTISKPSIEELQTAISDFVLKQRGGPKSSGWRPNSKADVTPVGNITGNVTPVGNVIPVVTPAGIVAHAHVTYAGNVSAYDRTPVGNVTPVGNDRADVTYVGSVKGADVTSDVTYVVPTVTSKEKELVERKKDPPSPPERKQPASAQAAMRAALTGGDDSAVTFSNGTIAMTNGVRAYWIERLGDDTSLEMALMEIAGEIRPNAPHSIQVQVESRLARKVREKIDRDRRYEAATKRNATGGASRSSGRYQPTQDEIAQQLESMNIDKRS